MQVNDERHSISNVPIKGAANDSTSSCKQSRSCEAREHALLLSDHVVYDRAVLWYARYTYILLCTS